MLGDLFVIVYDHDVVRFARELVAAEYLRHTNSQTSSWP